MTVSYDTYIAVNVINTTSVTTPNFTITSNADRAAMLCLSVSNAGISSITGSCGGQSGSAIANADAIKTNRQLLFGVTNPAAGSQTATMSWTTSCYGVFGVIVADGVDQDTSFNNGDIIEESGSGDSAITITSNSGDLTATSIKAEGAENIGGRNWQFPVKCYNGIYVTIGGTNAKYIIEYVQDVG
jgi:hypothetical protein